MKALFLDTETGGFSSTRNALTSVSAVYFDLTSEGLNIIDTFGVEVSPFPGLILEQDALRVQGITHADLHGPHRVTEAQGLESFLKWVWKNHGQSELEGALPIFAHNAPFDKGFVQEWVKRNPSVGKDAMSFMHFNRHSPWICTIVLTNALITAGRIQRPVKGLSLNSLVEHYSLKGREKDTHNSMEDCVIGANLVACLYKDAGWV